ncbi:MAG TPA: hypothetical protein VGN90_13930 [Pyrinomonadaceae bacterium]|jgi:hypothetical protein|nr:hypothetical protein [Pyrinomonadaceae bacterium]
MPITKKWFHFLFVLLLIASFFPAGRPIVSARSATKALSVAVPQNLDPAKVAAAIRANSQALKAFAWQQRMQLQLKGDTKKTTLNRMNYDFNGNLQKTLLSEQPPPDSSSPPPAGGGLRGRVKQKVVAKKTGEFKEMMEGIAALVKSYTELPPEQLQSALKQAAFSPGQGDMGGSVQIQLANLLQQGDSLTIWLDEGALLFRKIAIVSTYDQKPVTATANYSMLPSGQVYMAQAIVNYPSEQVVIEIDNLNYQKAQ